MKLRILCNETRGNLNSYYSDKLEQARKFQDYVMEIVSKELHLHLQLFSSTECQYAIGESRQGIEIKMDSKYESTGNLYIEIAEKSNADNQRYVPSGIYRKDNSWLWIIGDEDKLFFLARNQLQMLHKLKKYHEVTKPTSKGFLLPVEEAERMWAIKVIKGKNERTEPE